MMHALTPDRINGDNDTEALELRLRELLAMLGDEQMDLQRIQAEVAALQRQIKLLKAAQTVVEQRIRVQSED